MTSAELIQIVEITVPVIIIISVMTLVCVHIIRG